MEAEKKMQEVSSYSVGPKTLMTNGDEEHTPRGT